MTIITLMTDFGLKDGNVGVMKGVIAGIAPQAQIIDISHLISPQNIPEAALIFLRSTPFFPPGTIHVVVVDPGVGTTRRPMAARLGDQYFVGPDNGIITMTLDRLEAQGQSFACYQLDRARYWLDKVSHVFHGRDIFAPVAAHLATGVPLEQVGSPFSDPSRLPIPLPQRTVSGWRGEVIHVDHFGNIASNLRIEQIQKNQSPTIVLCGIKIEGLVDTFGERPMGELVALFGSTGNLIVAEVNGNAATRLGAKIGDAFEIILPTR